MSDLTNVKLVQKQTNNMLQYFMTDSDNYQRSWSDN